MLAVVKAKEAGVDNFSMIHDSFGCTAPDNKIMAKAVRDAFCEIYTDDVLLNYADEMKAMLSEKNLKKFPEMPVKGNLDLEEVKKSVFFCI
jgi:DNA-directed RNA polymerase